MSGTDGLEKVYWRDCRFLSGVAAPAADKITVSAENADQICGGTAEFQYK